MANRTPWPGMTLTSVLVSLGKDSEVHTRNSLRSRLQSRGGGAGEEENVPSTISHLSTAPPTCQLTSPLQTCSRMGWVAE